MTPFCVGHKKAQKRRGCPLEADSPLLMREVICEKDHVLRFLMECRWKFVGEKCEHFFQLNVCIGFRVSSTFGQSDGACPTHRRQWTDFLVSLMAPLHRQYKTARTETRRHLLLKIRQMPTQTSASRGYVLFDIKVAFMPSVVWCRKGHTQKSYKLSSGMRT